MSSPLPQSILFCCDHNAVRSPMAEGLMKKFYGLETYVQSAGVLGDIDIDGFAIAVCAEMGIELARHKSRSFDQMQKLGDELSSFDLIVALSPVSQVQAAEITRFYASSRWNIGPSWIQQALAKAENINLRPTARLETRSSKSL